MANVISAPKKAPLVDEMRWRCKVCGREMAYSQPITLVQQCLLIGAFIEGHEQCGQPKADG